VSSSLCRFSRGKEIEEVDSAGGARSRWWRVVTSEAGVWNDERTSSSLHRSCVSSLWLNNLKAFHRQRLSLNSGGPLNRSRHCSTASGHCLEFKPQRHRRRSWRFTIARLDSWRPEQTFTGWNIRLRSTVFCDVLEFMIVTTLIWIKCYSQLELLPSKIGLPCSKVGN